MESQYYGNGVCEDLTDEGARDPDSYSTYADEAFDADRFTSIFCEFRDYDPILVSSCGKRARFYVTKDNALHLDGHDRTYARDLMTAHLIVLTRITMDQTKAGAKPGSGGGGVSVGQIGGSGIITNASVGGVSVGMQAPQSSNAWEFWLNQTAYGKEYLAFLSAHVPMGIYGMGEMHRVLR